MAGLRDHRRALLELVGQRETSRRAFCGGVLRHRVLPRLRAQPARVVGRVDSWA